MNGATDHQRSLAAECTPLKRTYDSCFNTWFEGYLQPALDQTRLQAGLSDTPREPASIPESTGLTAATERQLDAPRRFLSTSWSSLFATSSTTPKSSSEALPPLAQPAHIMNRELLPTTGLPIPITETKGKTRAQVKAEEYERLCGSRWRDYQKCISVSLQLTWPLDYRAYRM